MTVCNSGRRKFLGRALVSVALLTLPLAACGVGMQPRPFVLGAEVNPPSGCVRLRHEQGLERADC